MADKAAYQWFKLFAEARVDRKLARLTLAERGVWVNLMCYASEQDDRGAFDAGDRFMLAIECAEGDEALLGATLEKLEQTRCIERHGERDGWLRFRTFSKRQESTHIKPSDSPERVAERVHKHREQQHLAALQSGVTPVTPCNAPVTPCNATDREGEEEGEAETEREQEAETLPGGGDGQSSPRARARGSSPARAAISTISTTDKRTSAAVVALCERIATRTRLPQRPDVLEQLAGVLTTHLARGLSPGDIERDVWNLIDPSHPRHSARPTVSKINNWLTHTQPAATFSSVSDADDDHGDARAERGEDRHGPNGPNGHAGHAGDSNGRTGYAGRRPLVAVAGGRRQPIIPDPTNNGDYAHLFTVSSDDDPDEE